MMEVLLVGLNGLLLMLVWRLMLKKSILDAHRDRLFDLRDALREKFVQENWDMNSALYRRLRDQINAYLRFTETYSFGEFVFMERQFGKRPELVKAAKDRSSMIFDNCAESQHSFMESFRSNAVEIMISYMVLSSGPLMIAMIFILPIAALHSLSQMCVNTARAGGRKMFTKALQLRDVIVAGKELAVAMQWQVVLALKASVAFLAHKLLYEDLVEEYSYDHAKRC